MSSAVDPGSASGNSDDDNTVFQLVEFPAAVSGESEESPEHDESSEIEVFQFRVLPTGDLLPEPAIHQDDSVFFLEKTSSTLKLLRTSVNQRSCSPVSRSDSDSSLGFGSGRSLSSESSDVPQPPPPPHHGLSILFCVEPSPGPQIRRERSGSGSGRRSSGAAPAMGWGLLRLGVAAAPEINLEDLRYRWASGSRKPSAAAVRKRTEMIWRFLWKVVACKCSPEEAISKKSLILRKAKAQRCRGEGMIF